VVFGWQEAYVGDLELSSVGAPTRVPLSLSHGEMVCVEVLRAALKEGSVWGTPTQKKMAKAPVPVEAAGANVTPRVDGFRVNEAEPRPEDAPARASLIPGSPRGPSFSQP
jgi:hypothetical protein